MKILPVEAELLRVDGQKDKAKLIAAFRVHASTHVINLPVARSSSSRRLFLTVLRALKLFCKLRAFLDGISFLEITCISGRNLIFGDYMHFLAEFHFFGD